MPPRSSLAIRVLGTYGGSAPGYRMTTFLIDGETALDAGALTETLPLGAQRRVRRVVLTHAHFDHFASLPFLVANLVGRESAPLEVAAPAPVISALRKHVFNDVTWPDFTRLPSPAKPTLRFRPTPAGRPFRAGEVSMTPVAVDHVVPGYGYVVSKPGRAVVFSGDTCPTERIWAVARRVRDLKAIFLEVSFSDTQAELARDSCHMTPRLVFAELAKMPPRVPVYLYHMKPPSLARIRREIAALREPRLKLLESERSFRF
ncbi:MAG TPA: 3',5'-cyclic-nucleotide phosphodiesterase [Thermoanaerobaculia bacterium]|nr:3',5'-cyclic-nucleotide phosphodiesterase [Thermoanaerobaculia bacterium]